MSAPLMRVARPDDLDAIMTLENETFGVEAWSAEAMRRDIADGHTHYVVVEAEAGGLSAYAGLLAPRGSGQADIQTIAVSADARGQGLGRALMNVLLVEARSRRAKDVFLEVRIDNTVAIGLYESLGFERIGVRAGYYQPEGVDALTMRLKVSDPIVTVVGSEGQR